MFIIHDEYKIGLRVQASLGPRVACHTHYIYPNMLSWTDITLRLKGLLLDTSDRLEVSVITHLPQLGK